MKDTQLCEQPGGLRPRAHLVTWFSACLGLLLLNPEAGYSAAIMVRQNINLNGNGITVDSYNSNNTNQSTGSQWDPAKAGDAGDVICIGGITNSVSIGNAGIYGRLYVAPGASVSIGPDGEIGTHAWQSNNFGIEPAYLVPNTNFAFTNISLPVDYPTFLTPEPGSVVTTNSGVPVTNSYDAVLLGGNYVAASGLGNTVVTSPSTLVLPNGYAIADLTIETGASLSVYVGGASMSIPGNDIWNQSGLPGDFIVYCTSNVTSLTLSATAPFSGVLIAPDANASVNGAGDAPISFSGAIMAKSLTANGHVNFHFDEALLPQGIVPQSPTLAASLMLPTMTAGSQFQFNVTGVPGFSYTVETSTDLTDWLPVSTNTSPFTFTDTNAAPTAQNFYRAVYYQ